MYFNFQFYNNRNNYYTIYCVIIFKIRVQTSLLTLIEAPSCVRRTLTVEEPSGWFWSQILSSPLEPFICKKLQLSLAKIEGDFDNILKIISHTYSLTQNKHVGPNLVKNISYMWTIELTTDIYTYKNVLKTTFLGAQNGYFWRKF